MRSTSPSFGNRSPFTCSSAKIAFINAILADEQVEFPPALVSDIGIITCLGWAVIESNPAWGAGLYDCDPDRVLTVLQRKLKFTYFACFGGCTPPPAGYSHAISMSNSLPT